LRCCSARRSASSGPGPPRRTGTGQWAGRFAGGWRCRPRAGRHAAGAVR
jgi:hypothetical protein